MVAISLNTGTITATFINRSRFCHGPRGRKPDATDRYRRPATRAVLARKPKHSATLVVSRLRRGWPSGFVASTRSRSTSAGPSCPVMPVMSALLTAGSSLHHLSSDDEKRSKQATTLLVEMATTPWPPS